MVGALVSEVLAFLDPAGARRVVLGLAGPPGAGKSTLAKALVVAVCEHIGEDSAAYVSQPQRSGLEGRA